MTGIAFNLILIRVAQSRVEDTAKTATLGDISGIQFQVNEAKTAAGQFGLDTTKLIAFNHHDDSNSLIQSNTVSVV